MHTNQPSSPSIPILDLSQASSLSSRQSLLAQLREALYQIGFLYITNHGVNQSTIEDLVDKIPVIFDLPADLKKDLSKENSPHFLGYSGFAEEMTSGKKDLREQWDFGSDVPNIWNRAGSGNGSSSEQEPYTELYWKLRGPNQWPPDEQVPGFRQAYMKYHEEVQQLSYRFVHLIEEAFGIPIGTFDRFWKGQMRPQHRIKLIRYPPKSSLNNFGEEEGQGVGAHKDSSGWLTFLYQVGQEEGLEALGPNGEWLEVPPIPGSFVVNFGNAFEAATEGAVKATVHRVKVMLPICRRFRKADANLGSESLIELESYIPKSIRNLRKQRTIEANVESNGKVSTFLDPRWDTLGESQLLEYYLK
ncbi:MAG: hypothetical protein M1822_007517 [Bathelium mastoideum]|nr:MAG: hypothetical protein M1822_007517 [Bathelium mastoideum]